MRYTLDKLAEEFKRQKLAEILAQCTPEQQKLFHERLFPANLFPNGVPADRLDGAYDLCERTLKKNREQLAHEGELALVARVLGKEEKDVPVDVGIGAWRKK
jgi:hypothetical protein